MWNVSLTDVTWNGVELIRRASVVDKATIYKEAEKRGVALPADLDGLIAEAVNKHQERIKWKEEREAEEREKFLRVKKLAEDTYNKHKDAKAKVVDCIAVGVLCKGEEYDYVKDKWEPACYTEIYVAPENVVDTSKLSTHPPYPDWWDDARYYIYCDDDEFPQGNIFRQALCVYQIAHQVNIIYHVVIEDKVPEGWVRVATLECWRKDKAFSQKYIYYTK